MAVPQAGRLLMRATGAARPSMAATAAPAASMRSITTCTAVGGLSGVPKQPHDDSAQPRARAVATNTAKAA